MKTIKVNFNEPIYSVMPKYSVGGTIMKNFCDDSSFLLGANYWASDNSIRMWEDWHPETVEKDFKQMASYGLTTLRVFLLWPVFQPLKAIYANSRLYEYRMMPGETPLPDTEAGQAGVSEEACQKFETFCQLAEKYDMKLIVGLLTGDMSFRSFAPEAFAGKDFLKDPEVIKWEIRYLRYFTKRFRHQKAILAWNLGNECNGHSETTSGQAYLWAHAVCAAIREGDPYHPVVSGYGNWQPTDNDRFDLRGQGEILDVMTTHPYYIFAGINRDPIRSLRPGVDAVVTNKLYGDISKKPCLIEEIGSIGYMACSEKTEADFARANLWTAFAHNAHAMLWWCAFDQGFLDYAPYDWNNLGSDYGLFRADGSAKPVTEVYRQFDAFLKAFPYKLPENTKEAVCIVPREQNNVTLWANTVYTLAQQANMDITFAHAEDKLPEADVYLLPSPTSTKPIFLHRLEELLEKVRNGATLYLSSGQLFRRIPELTGLTFAERTVADVISVAFGNHTFTFRNSFRYSVEAVADSCEVLARDDQGNPFFVRNAYGNGSIYFMPLAMENAIGNQTCPFDSVPWYQFYQAFVKEDRAAVSRDPQVLLTEHRLNNGHRLIIAVNYRPHETALPVSLRDGWKIEHVWYGSKEKITGCDACVWELCQG